jgi:hypothetical protein
VMIFIYSTLGTALPPKARGTVVLRLLRLSTGLLRLSAGLLRLW